MAKKEEFKAFASKHPELVHLVKSGSTSWQKLYEIYDIYGEQDAAWKEYFTKEETLKANDYSIKSFTDKLKNIDFNSIQEHINTAQKALGIVQELTSKGVGAKTGDIMKSVTEPRPINKIFED